MTFQLIKINESGNWHSDIEKRTTAIFGVYAFDDTQATYCCETTPSRCMVFIANEAVMPEGTSDEDQEEVRALVDGHVDDDLVHYRHVRDVDHIIEKHPELVRAVTMAFDEEEEGENAKFDQIREGWASGSLSF